MGLLKVGQLVTSRKGRDFGKKYVVLEIYDAQKYVKLADGSIRTLDRPKRKNRKHLVVHQAVLEQTPLTDKLIREFIELHSVEENRGEEGSTSYGQGRGN